MEKRKTQLKQLLIFCLCILFSWNFQLNTAEAFSGQVIQKGAIGDDVIELQSRLQYLGYFKGKVNGVFGWSTYWALRNFQSAFGMPIDGLAGGSTKAKLVQASKYNEQTVKRAINHGANPSNNAGNGTRRTAARQTNSNLKPTEANTPKGFSQNDIQLMANAVYG
ncbi:MAG: peptidoglycan-binding protein, partial [Bacillota bacterium]|nr:peptidoglycan-binding protein [Bacillota bacterium]